MIGIISDIAFTVVAIGTHVVLCAFFFWRRPLPLRKAVEVYIFTSWMAFALNEVGLAIGIWDFTSPVLGLHGTHLLYDLLNYPLKSILYVVLLGASWRFNVILTLVVTTLCTVMEWVALNYTHILVYGNWNIGYTFLITMAAYLFIWYLFLEDKSVNRY